MYYGYLFGIGPTKKAICSISSTCCGVVIPILENSKLILKLSELSVG